ncbi:MAG TPA: helix-turn-helix domain-containing protein [Rectinemataceae bacterium]|nr:helix-turn-helix domain-containing protein [Rectinemataceae bacterium]
MDDSEAGELCPKVEAAFALLARKWTGLIIRALIPGALYFCELEKAIPALSARVLALRMRELEEAGVVSRTVGTASPVRVSYSLTEKGRGLEPVVAGIALWAEAWSQVPEGEKTLVHADSAGYNP